MSVPPLRLVLAALHLAVTAKMPWASAEFLLFRVKMEQTVFPSFEREHNHLKYYDEWLSTSELLSTDQRVLLKKIYYKRNLYFFFFLKAKRLFSTKHTIS
jgi:hypothetical protein